MTRDRSKPRYAVCDRCGRNKHKVAIRWDDQIIRDAQEKANARAARDPYGRAKPEIIWPVDGLCPSCFADRLETNPDFPAPRGRIVYDLRARKPGA